MSESNGLTWEVLLWFNIFQMLCRSLIQNKVLPAGLQKLVYSKITNGKRIQICKQLVKEFNFLTRTIVGALQIIYIYVYFAIVVCFASCLIIVN